MSALHDAVREAKRGDPEPVSVQRVAMYDALFAECQQLRGRVGAMEEMLIEKQGTAARQYEIAREMHKSFIYHQGIVNYQERAARLSGFVRRGMGVET